MKAIFFLAGATLLFAMLAASTPLGTPKDIQTLERRGGKNSKAEKKTSSDGASGSGSKSKGKFPLKIERVKKGNHERLRNEQETDDRRLSRVTDGATGKFLSDETFKQKINKDTYRGGPQDE